MSRAFATSATTRFLIGERFMTDADPGAALEALLRRRTGEDRDERRASRSAASRGLKTPRRPSRLGADGARVRLLAAQSARRVRAGRARDRRRRAAVRGAVGVFVDAPADEVARIADEVGLDGVQLHGDERVDAYAALQARLIKAVTLESDD